MLITSSIHSTEVGGHLSPVLIAYRLATDTSAATRAILDNVIVWLVPSLNPDGVTIVARWYQQTLGTAAEGTSPPELYHHYVGHDDNRDWFMLTQKESQIMTRAVYKEWFPQVWLDEHQMGSNGPRIFVPPYADPVDPTIHPLVWREVNVIGTNMALRLEQANKSGCEDYYRFRHFPNPHEEAQSRERDNGGRDFDVRRVGNKGAAAEYQRRACDCADNGR